MSRSVLLLVAALLLIVGCRTASVPAEQLARETLTELLAYEKKVQDLDRAVAATRARAIDQARRAAATEREQLAASARSALAIETAERMLDAGFSAALVREFVAGSATAGREEVESLEKALAAARIDDPEDASMAATVRALRRKLEALQMPSRTKEQVEQYRRLLEAAREALKEKKEQ